MREIGTANTAATVVFVGMSDDEMGRVREALAAEAVLPSASTPWAEAIHNIRMRQPDVVLFSFEEGLDQPMAVAEALAKDPVVPVFIALTTQKDADTILRAVRVGFKEFVDLPSDAQRLRQVVHEAAFAPSGADDDAGVVVALIGAKGGVGTTLLTTQLAAELAGINRVIALDFDFATGDLASVLDLSPKNHIVSLLRKAERLDERMLTGSTAVHGSKVHVLAQPSDVDPTFELNQDDAYRLVSAAARAYQYVLIDCGCYLDPAVQLALEVADLVLLVSEPTVVSVGDAFRRMKTLGLNLGIDKSRIRLIINKQSRNAHVGKDAIQENLQVQVAGTVALDERTVSAALKEGKLLRDINRKAEVATDIARLVALITEDAESVDGDDGGTEDGGGGFFSSLFGRG